MAAAACLAAACHQIRIAAASPASWVERRVAPSILQSGSGGLYATLTDDLPPYRLTWDGRPPRAEVVDRRTGEVLAPAVLSRASLQANRNAVLWLRADSEQLNPEGCELVLEARLVAERSPFLALRFQVPPATGRLRLWVLLGLVLGGSAALARGAAKVVAARPEARLTALARGARSALFLLLAAACGAAHFPGAPWFGPETDVASINSFAAALEQPGAFARDALLDRREDFDWYIPLFVAFVRGVGRSGLPYGAAYAILGILGSWLGLAGYERLFTRLSRSPLFGLTAALAITFLDASYPPNEHWSFTTVLPRSLFSALLPWVVLLALRWLGPIPAPSPRRWWIAAAAGAALFYIHPVSSPALSAALLLGCLCAEGVRWPARLAGVASATLATALVMLPYALRYGAARQSAEGGGEGVPILRQILAPFEPHRFYADVLHLFLSTPRYWLFLAGMALLLALRPRGTRLFVAMLAGWGVVTFALPALDWALAERLGRQPFQFNLVRNLRYLDVWLLAILALLVRASRRKGRQRLRTGVQITAGRTALAVRARPEAAALAAAALALLCYAPSALRTASSLAAQIGASRATLLGRWRAVPSARLEALQAVQAFRRERETVLTPQDLEFFRQLRIPLVYTWKDPETLSYAAGAELALATRVVRRERALLEPPVDLADALALSTETGAGLLVVERWRTTLPLRESPFRLFQNDRYVVLRPPSPAPPPPPVAGGSPGGPASP